MKLIDVISYKWKCFMRTICKTFGINLYYHTKYGFKTYRGKPLKELNYDLRQAMFVSSDNLLLGLDGLYDEYTHVGIPIKDSPHYRLMVACINRAFDNCDYLDLEKCGALDSRDRIQRSVEKHMISFEKSLKQIESGSYNPITYYVVDNQKYIHDGKHRAALCALLNRKVYAIEINPNSINSDYIRALKKEISKNGRQYQKHRKIICSITNVNK